MAAPSVVMALGLGSIEMCGKLILVIRFQQSSAAFNVSDRSKEDNLYAEMLKNRVLFRACIARTVHYSEITPAKRSEQVVSATSLKVQGQQSAGVGIEFKVISI
jgi:hypothetical protein